MIKVNPVLQRILLHVAFWIMWSSRTFYDIVSLWGWSGASIFSGSYIATQIPLVYFHLYFLIPRFFNRKDFVIYGLCTITLLFAYSYVNYYVLLSIPREWIPKGMFGYIHALNPRYDIFEGLFVLITTYALKYTWMALSSQNKILQLQKDNLSLELSALKAQVNPHFLFNTLNNIYSLSLQKSDKTPDIILKLGNMMRYVLYECNSEKVPVQKEIQFINDYIELEKIRHEDLQIELDLSGNPGESEIAPLLLIPFIENSFKHGVNKQVDNAFVKVNLNVTNGLLKMNIENSTPNTGQVNGSFKGIGLENVKKRMNLLYPQKHDISIHQEKNNFKVNLTLHLN